jgi:predicted component of type VI protein secretion system
MPAVTFQVIDGVDKGRIFRDIPTPFTIGREEGNRICLNDERVSRFHLKVFHDQDDIVIVDMNSTNGTTVNGKPVTVCRLQVGDCIRIGRTSLLYGSPAEIHRLLQQIRGEPVSAASPVSHAEQTPLVPADQIPEEPAEFSLEPDQAVHLARLLTDRPDSPPPPPRRLTASQLARIVGFLELIHERLARCSREGVRDSDQPWVRLPVHIWHELLDLQMLVARYCRSLTEPEDWEQLS